MGYSLGAFGGRVGTERGPRRRVLEAFELVGVGGW